MAASIQQLTSISKHPSGNLASALKIDSKRLYHKLSPYANYSQNSLLNFGAEQPFMYTWIDQSTKFPNVAGKYESRSFPVFAAIQDTIRISKFLTSGNGVLFLAKQLLLNSGNSFNETRLYSPTEVLVSAARPATLGLTNRVTRHLDISGGGLVGILGSLVGIGSENSNQPSGTVSGGKTSNKTSLSSDGEHISTEYRGLSRAGTANKGLNNLESKWGLPSKTGFLGSLFANFIPATQDGIIYKSSEGAYGNMIYDLPDRLAYTNEYGTIVKVRQQWVAGGSSIRKSSEYPVGAGRFFVAPFGTSYLLSNDNIKIGKLNIAGLGDVGYDIKESKSPSKIGYRYGANVGTEISKDNNPYTNSDIMIQYQNYVDPKKEYSSKKIDKKSVDEQNILLNSIIDNIKYTSRRTYNISSSIDSSLLMDPLTTVRGYNRLFNSKNKNEEAYQYKYGILKDYNNSRVVDFGLSIGTDSLRLPTSRMPDSINTLTVIPAKYKDGTNDNWANLNLKFWESKWDPYLHDQIAFYFYDIVNQNYIPFRASITGISEGGGAEWEALSFIGRADKVYSYTGFTRTLSFKFTVNISSIAELAPTWQRINYLSTLVKPSNYTSDKVAENAANIKEYGTVSTNNITNRFMIPPMVYLNVGDMYRDQPVVLTSVGISIPDDASWETLNKNNSDEWSYLADYIKADKNMKYGQVPRTIDINVSMNLLEKEQPVAGGANFGHAPRNSIFNSKEVNFTDSGDKKSLSEFNKSLVVDVNK